MSIDQDHRRFRDIVRGKIKEDFKKYITHGEMIGKREKDYVKIPLPQIDVPRFKYGPKQQGGVGQGSGKEGDGVGQEGDQPGQGEAGDQAGEHVIEVDVSYEDLAQILGEQLQLPRIEPKGSKSIDSIKNKVRGLSTVGPSSLRHFKASFKEALKRAVSSGTYDPENPFVVPIKKDFRYRSIRPVPTPQANAVVIYMMDVSGSMGDEQKEIVRLESFWINTWLKYNYKGLETRFIVHDAVAQEVDEQTFFSTSASGGTLISSAYLLAKKMIETDYPPSNWNIYPFHFSDGDNWSKEDTKICMQILKDFFFPHTNMFGYGQVESKYGSGQFLKDLEKDFPEEERLILSRIPDRSKVVDSIKEFLGKGK